MVDTLIKVSNLTKSFNVHYRQASLVSSLKNFIKRDVKSVTVLDDLSFQVSEGEILGLIGLNGAGKTTTIKILSGVLHKDKGSIGILKEDPWKKSLYLRKNISLVMGQRFQGNPDLTPLDMFRFYSILYDIPKTDYENRVAFLCEVLNLTTNETCKQIRKLSLGQKMKVELVISFLHFPRVVFLDEPTLGLDFISQNTIRKFLKSYVKEKKAAVILTSHYFKDIEELADNLYIIDKGKEIFYGTVPELRTQVSSSRKINVIVSDKIENSCIQNNNISVLQHDCDEQYHRYELMIENNKSQLVMKELYQKNNIISMDVEDGSLESILNGLYKKTERN